jgi:NhaP-type Na+/H+ or K+/H+ antiporter
MDFDRWFLIVGLLLILMLLVERRIKLLPITVSMLYLGIGWGFGRLRWISIDALSSAAILERLAEVAVIVSLFCAGLKLRPALSSPLWRTPVVLATFSMLISVGLLSGLGYWGLGLPLGGAVLLAAILAPTDPVLASDVQVEDARDTDQVRFTLTGEAGLNDGTAFPFVMLGLGLLSQHENSAWGWEWFAFDLVWAVAAGLACGALIGWSVGRLIVYLRQTRQETVDLDDFLALGVIALSYGLALEVRGYRFLSVFAAGLSLRAVERDLSPTRAPADVMAAAGPPAEIAAHPEHAPAYMAEAVLRFTLQLERVGELSLVLLVGAIVATTQLSAAALVVALLILTVIRPLSVAPLVYFSGYDLRETALVSWFGIRGIGSVYYLFYAAERGVPQAIARPMLEVTIATIVLSVVGHGLTVTPLMKLYRKSTTKRDR